jgi:hypothetical protein
MSTDPDLVKFTVGNKPRRVADVPVNPDRTVLARAA